MDIKQTSKAYYKLTMKLKALENARKEMGDQIKTMMGKQGLEKLETRDGTFTVYNSQKWTFSEKVEALKEKEKKNGTAEVIINTSMRFTPKELL